MLEACCKELKGCRPSGWGEAGAGLLSQTAEPAACYSELQRHLAAATRSGQSENVPS